MNEILIQGILAFAATVGFCIIFRVPIRLIPVCALAGALAWSLYELVYNFGSHNQIIATFAAAGLVGLLADVFARVLKEAATIFIIPGILPLVPGAYIFYTMEALIENNMADVSSYGPDTLKIAAAIALGLLVEGAVTSVIHAIYHKTVRVTSDVMGVFRRR